jgi:hypothetical protein
VFTLTLLGARWRPLLTLRSRPALPIRAYGRRSPKARQQEERYEHHPQGEQLAPRKAEVAPIHPQEVRYDPHGAVPRPEDEREEAEARASAFARELRDRAEQAGRAVEVLGPVPAYIARRGGRWRYHVVLRGDAPREVLGADPGPPWSVDVDPESLL